MNTARHPRRVNSLAPLLTLALAGAAASAQVPDCCTDVAWKDSYKFYRPALLRLATSDGYLWGTFCFSFGNGYACGIPTAITVGQSYALEGGFSAGGFSANASATYSVEQNFNDTSGVCEERQLYARYRGVDHWPTLRPWREEVFVSFWSFYVFYNTFSPNGSATVRPCTQVDNTCPGCPRPPAGASYGLFEDEGEDGPSGEPDEQFDGPGVIVIELAQSFSTSGSVPPGHPVQSGGSSLDSLNQWQRCQIMQTVQGTELSSGQPVSELVIRDADGTVHFVDLVAEPKGLCACEIDYNDDGFLDQTDINAFIGYFASNDPAADLFGEGIFDLNDVIRFVQLFTTNCEGRLDP
jgi:hypothetical protein